MRGQIFDLIEYQDKARGTTSPRELFKLWDEVCKYYEQGNIGLYEWDEMKESIYPMLRELNKIKHMINEKKAA